jgi:DNA helicase-2/ATP-dependent DNA helicase PcrA
LLAYLRVIANPNDELSLSRIVNVPARGIGESALKLMQVHALSNAWTLWETLQKIDEIPTVTTRSANGVRSFVQLVQRWQRIAGKEGSGFGVQGSGEVEKGRLQTLIEDVVKQSGYEALLQKSTDEEKSELANVNELISSAAEFDAESPEATLEDYLNQVSLVSDVDTLDENGGAVTLMTLHAAKGLEFPVVAMIGMEEGVLPHGRVREHPEQLEEERRLCFVGITRAQQALVLSRANYRTVRGLRERTAASRFLGEVPPEMLEVHDLAGIASFGSDSGRGQRAMESPRQSGEFRRGQMVRHPQFGVGKIADISDIGQHTRAVVEFQRAGRKTLILQYARLEAVG